MAEHNIRLERLSLVWKQLGARLNTNILSFQYSDPHVKDKTILRPS